MSGAPALAKKSRAQKNASKRKRKREAAAAAATSTHDTTAAIAARPPAAPPIPAASTSFNDSGSKVPGQSNISSKKKRKLATSGDVPRGGLLIDPGEETPRRRGEGITASEKKPAGIDHSRHAAVKGQRQVPAGRDEHHGLPLEAKEVVARLVEEQQKHLPTTPHRKSSSKAAGVGRNKRKGPAASSEKPASASGTAGDGGDACTSLAGSNLKPHAELTTVFVPKVGGPGQAAATERPKTSSTSPGGQRSGGGGGVDGRQQQNGAKKKKKKKKGKKQQEQEAEEERQKSQPSPPSSSPPALLPSQLRKPRGNITAGPPSKRRVDGVTPSITDTGRSGSDGGGGGGDRNGGGTSKEGARLLSRALEGVRKKQREEIGKGRPLAIWDVAAYAGLIFGELAAAAASTALSSPSSSIGGYADGGAAGNGEVVAGAVDAVADAAQKDHEGQVSMSQFETLVRKEVAGFSARLRAASLLRRALEDEQAGDLDAAEAGCAACLAACPGFASGHLKMAKILRARGLSQQRAIRDVEFHLRQALGAASKAGTGAQGGEIAQAAAEGLSLLLCQEGRDKEAAKVLKRQGFRYRLSADVLRYPLPESTSRLSMPALAKADEQQHSKRNELETPPHVGAATAPEETIECRGRDGKKRLSNAGGGAGAREVSVGGTAGGGGASEFVAAFDGALPQGMLSHLQDAFGSRSRFWSEHGYNSETGTPGYFSYIHSLGKPPTTSIEQVIGHVRKLAERSFPDVKEAKFVEWWAHRRPHSSGHQMHFDSDNEGRGGVRNPIVSVVVYVTGDVGGPTLVTTQRLTSKRLADRGWIVHPRVNRVCMFDGGVLHGVIPGRGVPAAAAVPAPCAGSPEEEEEGRAEGTSERPSSDHKKRGSEGEDGAGKERGPTSDDGERERAGMRVTWMVAFWRDIQARPRPPPPPPPAATPRPPLLENKPKRGRVGEAAEAGVGARDPAGRRRPPPSGAGAAQPFPAMPPPARPGEVGRAAAAKRQGKNAVPEGERGGEGGGGKGGEGCSHPASPSWPALFRKKPDGWGGGDIAGGDIGSATGETRVVTPVPIPQVWEDVDAADNKRAGAGVRRLKRLPEYDLCFQGF